MAHIFHLLCAESGSTNEPFSLDKTSVNTHLHRQHGNSLNKHMQHRKRETEMDESVHVDAKMTAHGAGNHAATSNTIHANNGMNNAENVVRGSTDEVPLQNVEDETEFESSAARGSWLNPFEMVPIEQEQMHEFERFSGMYLELRNIMLAEWHRNVTRYLTFKAAVRTIQNRFLPAAQHIYNFLNIFGFINAGVLPLDERPIQHPQPSRKRVLVVGAGAAGIAAARHLMSFGHDVTVIEGRNRIGGRIFTERECFSGPVDLGASIITGLVGNPLALLCRQLLRKPHICHAFPEWMHEIKSSCRIYHDGLLLNSSEDLAYEASYNKLLEATDHFRHNVGFMTEIIDKYLDEEEKAKLKSIDLTREMVEKMDLNSGMELGAKLLGVHFDDRERKVVDWHVSNLEYGCATSLKNVSLVHWDQDDSYAFEGPHQLLRNGFQTIIEGVAQGLQIIFNHIVQRIVWSDSSVTVHTICDGQPASFDADMIICTASLGVLKSGLITFDPPLPQSKQDAIHRLGFGVLNKLVLEFPYSFWGSDDMFGNTGEASDIRGKFYIFWDMENNMHRPILVALSAGDAAETVEQEKPAVLVQQCLEQLRKSFGEIPPPISWHSTRWRSDPLACGSYSYIATGSSGADYEELAKPVNSVFCLAGEGTNRYYPATVPGAYLSGLWAAGRMMGLAQCIGNVFKNLESESDDARAAALDAAHLQRERFQTQPLLLEHQDHIARLKQLYDSHKLNRHHRRGIRSSFEPTAEERRLQAEAEAARKRAERERHEMQKKLDHVATMLLNGGAANIIFPEPLVRQNSVEQKHSDFVKHEGPVQSLFAMKVVEDDPALPSMSLFDDLDELDVLGSGYSEASSSAGRVGTQKNSSSRRKRSNVSSNAAAITIAKYIKSVVSRRAIAVSDDIKKTIFKKCTIKVLEDWNSKPRDGMQPTKWLNEKRRARITELCDKYIERYTNHIPPLSSSSRHHHRHRPSEQSPSLSSDTNHATHLSYH